MKKYVSLILLLIISLVIVACDDPVITPPNSDQQAANVVIVQIDALPAPNDLKSYSFPAVVAARSAFNALTPVRQQLVTNIQTLIVLENRKPVVLIVDKIANLPDNPENLNLSHAALLIEARQAVDNLSQEQRNILQTNHANVLTKLNELELRMVEILNNASDQERIDAVVALLNAFPALNQITLDHEDQINAANTAFMRLTSAQRAAVLLIHPTTLEDALDRIKELRAQQKSPLQIFYFNDFHGAIHRDGGRLGAAGLANVLIPEQNRTNINTLTITGGDMLHGELISNYFRGASTIDAFNHMGVDVFIIGNHEFNWGLDQLLQFWNGQHSVQANFALLGANIYYANTSFTQRPDGIEPYMIREFADGTKVGVIGLIGMLAGSISFQHIDGYVFRDPLQEAQDQIQHLNNQYDLDKIVVAFHEEDRNDSFATAVAQMGADVVLTAHDHQQQNRVLDVNGRRIPSVQSHSHGRSLAHIEFDLVDNNLVFNRTRLLQTAHDNRLAQDHPLVVEVLRPYKEIVHDLETVSIATAAHNMSQNDLTWYIGQVMAIQFNGQFGFHNSGGTRASLTNGQQITVADVLRIMPFENRIVVMELQGHRVRALSGSDVSMGYESIPRNSVIDNEWYVVVIHDFILFRSSFVNVRQHARNLVIHEIIVGELLAEAVRQQGQRGNGTFSTNTRFERIPDLLTTNNIAEFILPKEQHYEVSL